MAFLTEEVPARGVALPVAPGIRRIVAGNAGPMTYHGTNTWLIDEPGGVAVLDPGPDDPVHSAAIIAQAGAPVVRIILTHTHPDHSGGVAALKAATAAPVFGWGQPWLAGFKPDHALADGAQVGRLQALHTPGHASDHLCFALDGGVLFSGDQVMSWNTSIVSPPDGDMAAYMESLRLLLARDDTLYLCGHGPPLPDPKSLVRAMLTHRSGREYAILGAVQADPVGTGAIVDLLYTGLDARIKPAAERSVLAHLLKLEAEGRVAQSNGAWRAT